jgi:hypothetical protein
MRLPILLAATAVALAAAFLTGLLRPAPVPASLEPAAFEARLRADGFAAWACVEQAGYVRTTGIPLNEAGGYPLRVAAGNFRVGASEAALLRFYRVAARCSDTPVDDFRRSDGAFPRDAADGSTRCLHHRHGTGAVHEHGCAVAGAREPAARRERGR